MTYGVDAVYCSPSRTMVVKRRLAKSELVAAVLKRLDKPENWTKLCAARDGQGVKTDVSSLDAESWCVTGAMQYELTSRGFEWDHLTKALSFEIAEMFQEQFPELSGSNGMLWMYNDISTTTHEDVKMVLEKVHTKLIERGE